MAIYVLREKTDFEFELEALSTFCPNGCSVEEDEYYCVSDPKPSQEDLDAKIAELKAAHNAQEYARTRRYEYPSIEDVTVALAEKTEGDSTMWDEIIVKRAAVKTKWPKDNSGPIE